MKTAKKRSKKASKKRSKKTGSHVLPSLTTLVAAPKRILIAGKNRYETAIEMKEVPSSSRSKLFTSTGKRRSYGPSKPKGFKAPTAPTAEDFIGPVMFIGPRRQKRSHKAKSKQKLPADIAHLFK
jgi:hypothetical protein